MRRQRVRATTAAPTAAPVVIGIQLQRDGTARVRREGAAAGGTEVSGPYIVEIGNYAGYACTWIVWMRGAAAAEWSLTWDEMGDSPDAVEFDPAFDAADSVQIVRTNTTSTNIRAFATVAGTTYESDPISCAV